MTFSTLPSIPTLDDLITWCDLARDSFASTISPEDSSGIRQLKKHLSRLHQRHLTQLRQHTGKTRPLGSRHPRAWEDLLATMCSPDEDVVLGACGLLERSLIAAYARAEESPSIDPNLRRVLHRQRLDLKCSYSYYLRRLSNWRQRMLRQAEREEPVVGTLVPALV